MLYKITAKKSVTGSGWGLEWVDGTATTDNLAIAGKLAGKGYTVEDLPDVEDGAAPDVNPAGPDISTWTVAQLKDFAANNDIDLGSAVKKDDILTAIFAASKPVPLTASALT